MIKKATTVKPASSNKTLIGPPNRTTNSAISTGRPKQSYISSKKTSTVKRPAASQTKLPVPVAQKVPSEASHSNNRPNQSYTRVVAYTPTASRAGAGHMIYMSTTNPTGAKEGVSFATSCIPYVGDVKDIQEAVSGKDLITGNKLTGGDRVLTITAAVLPVVSGPMLKGAAKGGKIAAKEAPGALKKAEKLIKKNAPEVKKAVKNSDVASDTAKALKDKAIKKTKEVVEPFKGEKIHKGNGIERNIIKKSKDVIDNTAIKHSSIGDFTYNSKTGTVSKMKGGGHGQANIEFLKANGLEYNIVKEYDNGVRVGNVPGHKVKAKRSGTNQSWFPKEWSESDIANAGAYVGKLPENVNANDGAAVYGNYNGVRIGVIRTNGRISTIFPDAVSQP